MHGMVPSLALATGIFGCVLHAGADELDCITAPNRLVPLAFGASGVVADVATARGERVAAGQVLARLDTSVEEASIAIAEAKVAESAALSGAQAQLEIAERQVERARSLIAQKAGTATRLEEAESARIAALRAVREQQELKVVQALERDRLEALRSLRILKSPIDGVVVDVFLQQGELVDARTAMTVAQLDPMAIDVIAPSSLFGTVTAGDKAMVSLAMPAARKIEARIDLVDPYVDGASGTFRVRLGVPNPDNAIIAGLPCTALLGRD